MIILLDCNDNYSQTIGHIVAYHFDKIMDKSNLDQDQLSNYRKEFIGNTVFWYRETFHGFNSIENLTSSISDIVKTFKLNNIKIARNNYGLTVIPSNLNYISEPEVVSLEDFLFTSTESVEDVSLITCDPTPELESKYIILKSLKTPDASDGIKNSNVIVNSEFDIINPEIIKAIIKEIDARFMKNNYQTLLKSMNLKL